MKILEAVKAGIAARKLNQPKGGKGKSRGTGRQALSAGVARESHTMPAVTGHLEVEDV